MRRPRSPRKPQPQPARQALILAWLSELCMLGETYGHATARLWHERIRPDLDRLSANRQWERLKVLLQAHGVPHERAAISGDDAHEAPGACGLRLRITREQVDQYAEPSRKRCARGERCLGAKANGVFGSWFPPRRPHYYRDPTRRDGLTRLCATCHRVASARRHLAGLSTGHAATARGEGEAVSTYRVRRRAVARVASARYARGPGGEAARRKKALSRLARRLARRRPIVPPSSSSPPDQPEPQETSHAEPPKL